jgi:hypothetical protein
MPNQAMFINDGAFECQFSVQWQGGQSDRVPANLHLDLTLLNIPEGTSCWARGYIAAGPNHDSSDNFNYSAADKEVAVYTITGTTIEQSFSLEIIPEQTGTALQE